MPTLRNLRGALFLAVAALGSAAHGQGLFSVPNGDTLKAGTLSTDLELDSGRMLRSPATLEILGVRYGICDRLTVGEDLLMTGTVAGAPNFSVGLYSDKMFSLAGGYENVGVRSFGEQPYATLSTTYQKARVHLGWTRSNHDSLMMGAEYALTDKLSVQADSITGRDNFTTAGFQFGITNQVSVTAGYMHVNDPSQGNGIFLDLNLTLQTKRHGTH